MQTSFKIAALLCAQLIFNPLAHAGQSSNIDQTVQNWQLIDLDPNDGVTPYIHFKFPTLYYHMFLRQDNGPWSSDYLADSSTIYLDQSWQKTFSFQDRTVSMSYSGGQFGSLSASGALNADGEYRANLYLSQDFILSPNTLLLVQGEKNMNTNSATIDSRNYTTASHYIMFDGDHQTVRISNAFDTSMYGNQSANEAISFGYYNLEDSAALVSYSRGMYISGQSGVGVVTPTPSVPEAETWAMLLGGLGLCGWAARRRRSAR